MASVSESRFVGPMRELFSFGMYKRSQGRLLRTLTAAGLALLLGWGLLSLSNLLKAKKPEWQASFLFAVKADLSSELDDQAIPRVLRDAFQNKGKSLSPGAEDVAVSVDEKGKRWSFRDKVKGAKYRIALEDGELQVWTSGLSPTTCNSIAYGVPVGLGMVAAWGIFLLYNWPRFADFLIATEAEMTKVSWSSKPELKRATAVVLITLFVVAGFLFSVDMIWSKFLEKIKVLQEPKPKTEQATSDADSLRAAWDYLAISGSWPPHRC